MHIKYTLVITAVLRLCDCHVTIYFFLWWLVKEMGNKFWGQKSDCLASRILLRDSFLEVTYSESASLGFLFDPCMTLVPKAFSLASILTQPKESSGCLWSCWMVSGILKFCFCFSSKKLPLLTCFLRCVSGIHITLLTLRSCWREGDGSFCFYTSLTNIIARGATRLYYYLNWQTPN